MIVDYCKLYEVAKKKLYSRRDISKSNKQYVKSFLKSYGASDARKNIFIRQISHLLCRSKDIKKDFLDSQKIDYIFAEIKEGKSISYYATIINVSKVFVRWLNDGQMPAGFRNIKNVSKNKQKRNLNPKDMITWEDGQELAGTTTSLQMKAIPLTELDGGFRPSEFIDLNYGDMECKGKFIIAHVRKGKTGPRSVILFRSVPFLLRWLHHHPTKKDKDPLWVLENASMSRRKGPISKDILRYSYPAIAKRVKQMGLKCGLNKPLDFYNLRHSACTIAKKDNLNTEIAAGKFGHSVEFFVSTYARLDTDAVVERFAKAYGEGNQQKVKEEISIKCNTCDMINEPGNDICERCNSPLTLQKALSLERNNNEELRKIKEEHQQMKKKMDFLMKAMKNMDKIEDIVVESHKSEKSPNNSNQHI